VALTWLIVRRVPPARPGAGPREADAPEADAPEAVEAEAGEPEGELSGAGGRG
jgi:hypothetical protein